MSKHLQSAFLLRPRQKTLLLALALCMTLAAALLAWHRSRGATHPPLSPTEQKLLNDVFLSSSAGETP